MPPASEMTSRRFGSASSFASSSATGASGSAGGTSTVSSGFASPSRAADRSFVSMRESELRRSRLDAAEAFHYSRRNILEQARRAPPPPSPELKAFLS